MNTPDSRPVDFLEYEGSESKCADGEIVIEAPICIRIKSGRSWRVMAAPKQIRELAVGLLFAEGVPNPIEAIESIEVDDTLREQGPDELLEQASGSTDAPSQEIGPRTVTLVDTSGFRAERGGANENSSEEGSPPKRTPARLQETLQVSPQSLYRMMDSMTALQDLKRRTRGTHAMALVDIAGNVVAFAEDIGRHNALDKVIGHCMLEGRPLQGLIAIMSSRVSHEMAMKAIRAGIQICASISAPTTLAIDAAERYGLTVACFVKNQTLTVFTHPQRIPSDEP
jgi:FdhD protein